MDCDLGTVLLLGVDFVLATLESNYSMPINQAKLQKLQQGDKSRIGGKVSAVLPHSGV